MAGWWLGVMLFASLVMEASAAGSDGDWHTNPEQRRDAAKWFQRYSNYKMIGPENVTVLFSVLIVLGSLFVFGVIGHAIFGGPKKNRMLRIAKAVDSLTIVWLMIFGLSVTICCVDIFDAQKLWLKKYEESKTFRGTQELRTGRWFIAGAIPGTFSICMLIGTYVFKRLVPEANQTPVQKAINMRFVDQARNGPPSRYHALDHLKYLALIYVVTAHFVSPESMHRQVLQQTIAGFAWSWAMPAFAFCSGYNAPVEGKDIIPRRRSRILKLAICYFIATAMYILFFEYVIKSQIESKYAEKEAKDWISFLSQSDMKGSLNLDTFWKWLVGRPWWHLWYLQSLIFWQLLTPYWMTLRFPIVGSLVLSVCALYMTAEHFSAPFAIARSLEYFPYVVIGASTRAYAYTKPVQIFAAQAYSKAAAGAVLFYTFAWILACPFNHFADMGIFQAPGFTVDFKMFDRQRWYGIGKIAYIVYSTAVMGAIIIVCPNRKTYFSVAASNSLVPYIYHYALLLVFMAWGLYGTAEFAMFTDASPEPWRQILYVGTGFLWGNFLFIPQVAWLLKHPIMPPTGMLFRKNLQQEITEEGEEKAKLQRKIAERGNYKDKV
mmetsp:Transcript_28780/g.70195  ORF Transcript_28780/g.70195 Transcript_28780/m.70195 type:complete len:604 (-) Transcript_28780:383-2194(-)